MIFLSYRFGSHLHQKWRRIQGHFSLIFFSFFFLLSSWCNKWTVVDAVWITRLLNGWEKKWRRDSAKENRIRHLLKLRHIIEVPLSIWWNLKTTLSLKNEIHTWKISMVTPASNQNHRKKLISTELNMFESAFCYPN